MKRVSFYIDGFNLYHSLKDNTPEYRWLNLKKLCETYLREDEIIANIYYFTAIATWNKSKAIKHKNYIRMLEREDVKIEYGKFKRITRHCNTCNQEYFTHEEKRTDVNIALKLFSDAVKDTYDTAILLSADSDLIPPIEAVRKTFLNKKVGVLIPLGRPAKELKQISDFSFKIDRQTLKESLFEEKATVRAFQIEAPLGWLPEE